MSVEVLSTSDISKLIGMQASVSYIKMSGIEPAIESPRTTLWRKSDVPAILRGIATHLNRTADTVEELRALEAAA